MQTKKASLLFETAKLIRGVRIDILNDNWDSIDSIIESVLQDEIAISDAARVEFDLIQGEIHDRKIISYVTTAISNSSIGVDNPKNVEELSNAIEVSEKIGTISSKSQRLLSAAKFMLELRLAYGSSNWRRVGRLLTSISINLLPEIVQPEVFRIRNNLLEHTAREKVISSLKHGGLCGSPASIEVSTISTDSLDASIRYINAMSNESENIKYLEKIVVAIRRLRKSTLERDIGAQVNCLSYIDAFIGTTEKEWISNELSLTKILIENEEACEKILSALREGDGIGEPGALDTSTISTKDLHAALERERTFTCYR